MRVFKLKRYTLCFFSPAWKVSHAAAVCLEKVVHLLFLVLLSLCGIKVADSSWSPDPFSLPTMRRQREGGRRAR